MYVQLLFTELRLYIIHKKTFLFGFYLLCQLPRLDNINARQLNIYEYGTLVE